VGPRRAFTLALAAAAAAPLAALLPALLSGLGAGWGDASLHFAPLRELVVQALRAGRLPLWNPWSGTGAPLFAEAHHGVLHPLSLLAALDPAGRLEPLLALQVSAAGAGAAVLGRVAGLSATGAAAAGLAYGLSGWTLSMTSNPLFLAAGATVPWTLAALRRAGEGARHGTVLAALAVAAQLFAGEPQSLALALGIGTALALQAGGPRGAGRALAAAGVGLLLAGVQAVPSAAQFLSTTRFSQGTGVKEGVWALVPGRLLELGIPGLLMRFDEGAGMPWVLLSGDLDAKAMRPFVPAIHLAAPVLLLAAAAVREKGLSRWLAAGAIFFLWAAAGPRLGASAVLGRVPGWGLFRYPEKLVGPATLLLALLAGIGLDRLSRLGSRMRLGWAAAGLAAAAAALALAAAAFPAETARLCADRVFGPTSPETLLAFGPMGPEELASAAAGMTSEASAVLAQRLATSPWFAAASLAALALAAWRLRRPAAVGVAVCGIVAAHGVAARGFALHLASPEALSARLLVSEMGPTPDGSPRRYYVPWCADPTGAKAIGMGPFDAQVRLDRRCGTFSTNVASGIDSIDLYTPAIPRRLAAAVRATRLLPTGFRRFAVNAIVATSPIDDPRVRYLSSATAGGRLAATDPVQRVSAWEVPSRPWASFATDLVPAAGLEPAAELFASLAARDAPQTVIEGPGPLDVAPGRVVRYRREPERVLVEAEARGPATLVVADAYAPGWRATIDGAPVAVRPADVLLRAVAFPAGRHVLEMRYEPPELRWGLEASLAGLVALLALWAWERRRSI
jgi:hypothetical protein